MSRGRLWEISDRPRLARAVWAAIAVLLGCLHLFVHGAWIDRDELILDEAGTWGVAVQPLGRLLTLPTEFHSQPPLYYIVLHLLLHAGSAPWFLRGFSWLCCLLFIGYALFFIEELSLLARVVLCLLFLHGDLTHYLATSVRPYAMAAFCTLVASVTLVRLARAPTRRRLVAYAAWALAM